jgi:ribosomal protein L22
MVLQVLEQLNQVQNYRLNKMVEDKKDTKLEEKKILEEKSSSENGNKDSLEKKSSSEKESKNDKMEDKKEVKTEDKTDEKKEDKTEDKKKIEIKKDIVKKDSAIVNGASLKISRKYSVFVCKMLKGKTPDKAIEMLEEVVKGKRPVPMAALEVPHQRGKGIGGAKYPKNVAVEMIKLVKQAKANAIVNGIENPFIAVIKTNQAPRPFRKDRTRGKRAHVYIELKSKAMKV